MARRWSREHEERVQRILALMRREARPFEDMSSEAQEARRSAPFAEWCHTYLPHWFRCADAPWHAEADALRNEAGLPTFWCWARGTGKSALIKHVIGLLKPDEGYQSHSCQRFHTVNDPGKLRQ